MDCIGNSYTIKNALLNLIVKVCEAHFVLEKVKWMATIGEIKKELENIRPEERLLFIERYKEDGRSGVQKLVASCRNGILKEEKEAARLEKMLAYEKNTGTLDISAASTRPDGGPLAGPVVAGAVILPKGLKIPYLNDSKQLSEKRREALYDQIMASAVAVGAGIVSPERIDEINILQATYEAMRQAVESLDPKPQILLNDAVIIPGIHLPQEKIIKGDAKSLSIAAASVIAKVTRDRMMKAYHEMFPEYGFDKHKGYGSREHIEAIQKIGPCPIHRRSFLTHFI